MNRMYPVILLLALGLGLCPALVRGATDRLTTLDGAQVECQITGIDASGRLQTTAAAATAMNLDALRSIERATEREYPGRPAAVVYQRGGGVVFARQVSLGQGKVQMERMNGEALALPVEVVMAVWFKTPETWYAGSRPEERFLRAMRENAREDRVFVVTPKGVQSTGAVVQEIGSDKAKISFEGETRELPRARLYGVVLAGGASGGGGEEARALRPDAKRDSGDTFGGAKDAGGTVALVHLSDGSSLSGQVRGLADDQLRLGVGTIEVGLPWNKVMKLEVRSSRLAFVSDLEPTAVEEDYFPTDLLTWRRDQSVTGEALRLGGRTYAKGLGMHPTCRLTYDVAGRYQTLVGVIGLQPPVTGMGQAEFVVRGDGRELYRQAMTGRDPVRELRLEVSGVRRLTVAVEAGGDVGLGAHAVWGDLRLVRENKDQR